MAAPLFEFRDEVAPVASRRFYPTFGKRFLDLTLLVLMLPVALPLIATILFVSALGGGRALYSQIRIGRDGHETRLHAAVCRAVTN